MLQLRIINSNSMGIAVKFGINTTLVVLEMVNFQYNTRGIYPKFHCYTHAIPS